MQKYCRKYKKTRASETLYNIVNSDDILRHDSLLRDIIESRMKRKATDGNGYKC